MALKWKKNDAGNSDLPERSHTVLPVGKNMKVLNMERKKNSYAEVAKISGKNESPIHEIVKKEKQICSNFTVMPQTAKVTSTLHNKCLT